jgi:hypothetical protein
MTRAKKYQPHPKAKSGVKTGTKGRKKRPRTPRSYFPAKFKQMLLRKQQPGPGKLPLCCIRGDEMKVDFDVNGWALWKKGDGLRLHGDHMGGSGDQGPTGGWSASYHRGEVECTTMDYRRNTGISKKGANLGRGQGTPHKMCMMRDPRFKRACDEKSLDCRATYGAFCQSRGVSDNCNDVRMVNIEDLLAFIETATIGTQLAIHAKSMLSRARSLFGV